MTAKKIIDTSTTIFLSDDCSSEIHEFCQPCECPCHGVTLSNRQAAALYEALKHDYINYNNQEAHEALRLLGRATEDGLGSTSS